MAPPPSARPPTLKSQYAPPPPARPPPARPPPARIPRPVGIGRVAVELRADRVLVTTDVTIPRAGWGGEDLDVHVAFGAPGAPRAADAALCATDRGHLVAPAGAPCVPLPREPAWRAPAHAAFVVGRPAMAGATVHLGAAALRDAFAPSGLATLRLREVRDLPAPGPGGAREIVVRLGAARGEPFVLGTVEVAADAGAALRAAGARLCGPNIDETRIAVSTSAKADPGATPAPRAPRSSTDDLCVELRM